MMSTRGALVLFVAGVLTCGVFSSALAQEGFSRDTFAETSGPAQPFLVEPVLPAPTARLQTHIAPVTGPGDLSTVVVTYRLLGSWKYSETVVGEGSLPILSAFPDQGDGGAEIGNPRVGMEFPVLSEGLYTHRWTVSLDFFLPFAQVNDSPPCASGSERTTLEVPDCVSQSDYQGTLERIGRYGVGSAALPTLQPDLAPDRFSTVIGTHYRLRKGRFITQVGVDLPILMGFDLGFQHPDGTLLHEVDTALRYGAAFGVNARPVFPSLEFVGVSQLSGDDDATALLASLGVRAVFREFEPGVAVTYPITLGPDNLEGSSVYVSIELAYRLP